jgi:long-chain acyl-CoA synthetase
MEKEINYDNKPWVKFYEPGIKSELEYEEMTLPQYFDRTVKQFPDNMALNFMGYRITFKQLNEMVGRMVAALKSFGVKKGDKVALVLPNMIPTVVAQYAVLKLGAIVVMNNPLYSDREIKHQVNDSKSKVLITLDLLGNRMVDLMPQTGLNQVIYTSIGDYLPFPKNILFPLVAKKKKLAADVKVAENVYKWKDILKKFEPDYETVELRADDPCYYQYTGGTTGKSKGAILTHGNMGKQMQQVAAWFPSFYPGEEKMLGALPFFHVFGLTTSMNFAIYFGWENILVPKPQPDQLLEAISKYKPSFAPLVPTMYIGILNHPKIGKTDISSIKGCFSGSAPLPVEVIKEFEAKTGATIVEGFGLTESSPVTHINPFAGSERKIGSIGLPIPDTECRIVDIEEGEKLMPVGESGELIMRGPQIMQGYLNRPEMTQKALRNGWLYTGDIAKMDEQGYFYIVDRKKDMIISGGLNVYPREIDEVYFDHPKVMEACTIGIPHEHRGESAKVYIVLKEGETATEQEMIEYVHDKLAKYKWPVEIEFAKELPKSAVGKILRKDLREQEMAKRAK